MLRDRKNFTFFINQFHFNVLAGRFMYETFLNLLLMLQPESV